MSAHTCTTLTEGCYRCELHRDEIDAFHEDIVKEAQDAWLAYRDGPMKFWPTRQLRRRDFVNGYLAANGMAAVVPA